MQRRLVALTALALSVIWISSRSLAQPGDGSGHDSCPDVRASQIDAYVSWGGEVKKCGIGIGLFGLRLSIAGPSCPDYKFIYPSHQACLGTPSEGTYCAPAGVLSVKAEKCECGSATIAGTGLLIPSCNCTVTDGGGHVEDAQTLACSTGGAG